MKKRSLWQFFVWLNWKKALSKELRRLGHDVRAVLPRYRRIDLGGLSAIVRGLQLSGEGSGADLLMPRERDLFR